MTSAAAVERPRLLYIDDDAGLCRLIGRGMDRRGFETTTVSDPAAAVARATSERFDVVAVDHYMPVLDGLQTLGLLRLLPDPPPVVYVTGSDESRLAVAALKAGAADYVVKSTADDFQDLLASALNQALGQVRLRRERDVAQSALARANASLEAIVARQDVLLREVNHRVANSLQLIASLVHLQASALEDDAARSALQDIQSRIAAVMQVHRRLYTSDDIENVDMSDYLTGLVAELQQSLSASGPSATSISLRSQAIQLNPDKAVSLGVVVAELVTNAFKYAYPPGQPGEVRVNFDHDGHETLRLCVEDDGRGFDETLKAQGTGLGRRVIAAMARSLGSQLEFDPTHRGARARAVLPRLVVVAHGAAAVRRFKSLDLLRRQLDLLGRDRLGEVVGLARPDDRRSDRRLRQHPRQRHLHVGHPLGLRHVADCVHYLEVVLGAEQLGQEWIGARPGALATAAALVRAGQEPSRQRRPGDDADPLFLAERQHLALLLAVDEVVLRLHRDEAGPAVQVG